MRKGSVGGNCINAVPVKKQWAVWLCPMKETDALNCMNWRFCRNIDISGMARSFWEPPGKSSGHPAGSPENQYPGRKCPPEKLVYGQRICTYGHPKIFPFAVYLRISGMEPFRPRITKQRTVSESKSLCRNKQMLELPKIRHSKTHLPSSQTAGAFCVQSVLQIDANGFDFPGTEMQLLAAFG